MRKVKWTFVFEPDEIDDIISRFKNGEAIHKIANSYSVSRPTIGRVLRENNISLPGKKRGSSEFITENTQKECTKCGRLLPLSEYSFGNGKYKRRSVCKECDHKMHNTDEMRERRRKRRDERRKTEDGYLIKEREIHIKNITRNETSYKKYMLRSIKRRAKEKGIPFNITIDDFEIPEYCPLLGIKLNIHVGNRNKHDNIFDSPSLDKINPKFGYVKGNVMVVSYRANCIKNNATPLEIETLLKNLKKYWKE